MKIVKEVKIYQPAISAMQSGRARNRWVVEMIENENLRHLDEVMAWVSVDNTMSQLKFDFATKEEAIDFAEKSGYKYQVEEPKKASLKNKSYAANFV